MEKINMIPHSRPLIVPEDFGYMRSIMRSGMLMDGSCVDKFENELKNYLNTETCFTVSSGTAALFLAIRTLNIGKGDEVVLPTYVCSNVLLAVLYSGATPVFCDIGKNWNMTLETVAPHISKKTKAIILVHIFGIIEKVDPFLQFKIPIIEDRCQAFIGRKDKISGKSRIISLFSFHATKCLTTGSGGAIATDNPDIGASLKKNRDFYRKIYPITDIQAALGLSQLKRYKSFLAKRLRIANYYLKYLPVSLTKNLSDCRKRSIFFRFPVINEKSDFEAKAVAFERSGIIVRRGVDALLHRKFSLTDKYYKNAVHCFNHTVSLPIYPALSDKDMEKITEKTKIIW